PGFGLACLGKVNMAYENDRDLMILFYGFVAKEEIACEEAELGPEKYAERVQMQQKLQAEQLEMLQHMRNFHLDDQSAILEKDGFICSVRARWTGHMLAVESMVPKLTSVRQFRLKSLLYVSGPLGLSALWLESGMGMQRIEGYLLQSREMGMLHQQIERANFDSEASLLSVEQIQEIVRRRVTPVFGPR
ncbi:hypothetical protein RJ639_030048, partial [Escallonia herrerae]